MGNESKIIENAKARKKFGDGWALPAVLAATGLGYEAVGLIGALLIPTGYAVGLYIKKRRGPYGVGKKREWWVPVDRD